LTLSNWKKSRLGDFLTFQRGFDITKRQQVPGPYAVISSSGVKSTHNTFKVRGPGVVIGRKGSLGTVFFSRENFWPHDTTLWVKDFHGNDVKFAFYFLKTLHLEKYDVGAANPTLNRNHVHLLPITVPPLNIQRKIAMVLSAYDDFIENNTQRIAILEEMAQTIYGEWFVNFRFPRHENARMTESELGIIPADWETKNITEVSFFRYIGENISRFDGKKEYFATANIRGTEIVEPGILIDFENKPSRAQKQPLIYSVWFARMKETYKVLGFTEANESLARNSILSSGFAGFQSKKEHFGFLYNLVRSKEFHGLKDAYCTGATQMALTNDGLSRISMVLPPEDLITNYSKIVDPIIDQCLFLRTMNDNLRQARDLLISILISGGIDVNELDIDISSD